MFSFNLKYRLYLSRLGKHTSLIDNNVKWRVCQASLCLCLLSLWYFLCWLSDKNKIDAVRKQRSISSVCLLGASVVWWVFALQGDMRFMMVVSVTDPYSWLLFPVWHALLKLNQPCQIPKLLSSLFLSLFHLSHAVVCACSTVMNSIKPVNFKWLNAWPLTSISEPGSRWWPQQAPVG